MQRFLRAKTSPYLLLAFLLCCSLSAFAQKVERESRIKPDQVPTQSLTYIEATSLNKVNWYKETGLDSVSFEAKFKFSKRWFSVEFSEDGDLEDIEIEIALDQLQPGVKGSIIKHLENEFTKFKVQKIQIQYTETPLQVLLNHNIPKLDSPHAFEIVVKGKKSKVTLLWELVFDSEGQFVSINQIVTRTSTHLEY